MGCALDWHEGQSEISLIDNPFLNLYISYYCFKFCGRWQIPSHRSCFPLRTAVQSKSWNDYIRKDVPHDEAGIHDEGLTSKGTILDTILRILKDIWAVTVSPTPYYFRYLNRPMTSFAACFRSLGVSRLYFRPRFTTNN